MEDITLTPAELAAELRVSAVTLKRWRAKARGPMWVSVGRSIRYPRKVVDEWKAQRVGRKLK